MANPTMTSKGKRMDGPTPPPTTPISATAFNKPVNNTKKQK
jgi:hypothetical protein